MVVFKAVIGEIEPPMMSHRRKSARPTNKLRRNAADTSSVSSEGSDADHNTKMVLEDYMGKDSTEPLSLSPAPQLALPPDLWHDFQALQAATHLDTASLIRRLIHQYDRGGSQDDIAQVGAAGESDPAMCVDEHTHSPCGNNDNCAVGEVVGETGYYSGDTACYGSDVEVLPRDYHHPAPGLPVGNDEDDDNDDCLILDLSSGGRASNTSFSTAPAPDDVRMVFSNDGDRDSERPLDLTVSKAKDVSRASAAGCGLESLLMDKAPMAHRTPSSTILLPALPHGLVSTVSSAELPREAHSSMMGSNPSPRHVSSSLFNLSELPMVGQKVCSAAQTEKPRTKLSASSGGTWCDDAHTKQKIVQHFLSLPAGQVVAPEPYRDLQEKQGCSSKGNCPSDALRHSSLPTAVSHLTSSPSLSKNMSHLPSGAETVTTPAAMQLPTVAAFEFQGASKQVSGEREGANSARVAVSLPSLPTSASAILLDVGSGGLVATAGGGLAGVSAVNIPLMATGAGGLVAIPLLQALPEALAAAVAAQGQAPHHQPSPSAPPTSDTHPHFPPQQTVHHEIPPPPPYSAAVAGTTQPKKYKAKIGRPRGQPKSPKAVSKDMKLLTENTLFPGVYTSILKLPWSKRSRGKSSAKIKDVVADTSSPAAAAVHPEKQHAVVEPSEPGEMNSSLQQQMPQPHFTSVSAAETGSLGLMPVPVVVQNQVSVPSTPSSSTSSMVSSSSSSSSLMMVYQNSIVSDGGKPVRRRGRPPKLPVLSQLLADRASAADPNQAAVQAIPMEAAFKATTFNLVPVTSQPVFDSSALAFSTNVIDSRVVAVPTGVKQESVTGIKQEPMDVTDIQGSKLFAAIPVRDRRVESSQLHVKHQVLHQIKQEADEHAVSGVDDGSCKDEVGATDKTQDEKFQEASLETRFNILANQLGLEIGSPYHASLVYGQTAVTSGQTSNSAALYQQMMLSSRSMVEMKPRRRQLNNLIKPSDDCVYTSFRIRPRNSGRRGGKRGARRRGGGGGGGGSRYNGEKGVPMDVSAHEDFPAKDIYYRDKDASSDTCEGGSTGSAVITEQIPGAGDVPQRLYRDLYHCKLCNELLPADESLPHTCSVSVSPPLGTCDMCGTMYLSSEPSPEGTTHPGLCDDCIRKSQYPSNASLSPDSARDHSTSEGFSCRPCGVQFVNIADYIQHRRNAHLEKMNRQSRKTHTLKTLPCPARGCPRLFHMHAELTRHIHSDHPEEEAEQILGSENARMSPPANALQDLTQDVDVETIPDAEEPNCTDEEQPQFACTQKACEQRFSTPIELLEHVQSAHEDVSHWPCPLPGCTRQFSTERHLRVHLLMHKDEKPLKCLFCNYRCRQKNALNWHMRKHPEAVGQYRKFAGMSPDT